MSIEIGPKGYIKMFASNVGPKRQVKVVAFTGPGVAGEVAGPHFPVNASKQNLAAVLDITDGKNRSTEWRDTGSVVGDLHITHVDTGVAALSSGHVLWAFITDTE
jgi:hypothetical protein